MELFMFPIRSKPLNGYSIRYLSLNIIKSQKKLSKSHDLIGPPDPVSNLRPIIRCKDDNESKTQSKLRLLQIDTQQWNQNFWKKHNSKFVKEREAYVKCLKKSSATADEMSVFYKEFLDKNWRRHIEYNLEWYRRNFSILYLSLVVNCEKIWKKMH